MLKHMAWLIALICPNLLLAQIWHITFINQTALPLTLNTQPSSAYTTLPNTLPALQTIHGTVSAPYAVIGLQSMASAPGKWFVALSEYKGAELYKCQYGYQCTLLQKNSNDFSIIFTKKEDSRL